MIRKLVAVLVVVAFTGIALGEDIRGIITKVEGNKVTYQSTTFDKDTKTIKKGDPQTATVADNCKVAKGKFNKDTKKLEAGDPVPDGLKNEMFTKITEKGVGATLTVENGKVTQIIVGGFGKGK